MLEGENKVVRNIGLDLKWPMKPFGNGMPFGRLVLVARDIMPLIASRPLDATDLATVNEISEERKKGYDPRKIDVIELVERAKKVSDLFISSINELKDLVPEWPQQRELNSDERGKLRSRLHILAGFGRPECLPTMEAITSDNTGPSEEESWRAYSAWNTLDNAKVIIEEKLKALVDLGERTADAEKGARDLLSMMFGPMFPVIPLFNPLHEELLNANLHQSRSRQGEDDLLSHEWMRRMGKVRSNLALFQEVMIGASGLGGSDQLILRVCQLPDVRAKGEVEPWVGWKMEKERMPKGGRLSLVMHIPWLGVDSSNDPEQIISPAEPISGLMIDQWNEVIPSPTETTALVFNHSTPAACAPQTILLAVMEQNGSQKPPNWTLQGLETLLRSTLQQAKMRGVDLTMTKGTGQILPANFFTYNEKNATVSTDILGADKEGAEAISRFRRVVG
jgi:hypothetical protein